MKRTSLPVLLTLLTACSSPAEHKFYAVTADLDQPFTLKIGERARIDGAGLFLRVISVPADSRCPSNALILCVWEGDAAVVIELAPLQGDALLDTLHTTLEPKSHDVGTGILKLLRLDPYPEGVTPIPTDEYAATFIIEHSQIQEHSQ